MYQPSKTVRKLMAQVQKITVDRIMDAIESGEYIGFCTACGAEADCVEPDACCYKCEECGANKVFGAEELLMRIA